MFSYSSFLKKKTKIKTCLRNRHSQHHPIKMHQTRDLLNLLCLLFLLILCCFSSLHQACNQTNQEYLLSFSQELSSSSSPLNWSTRVDCCYWEGIQCNNKNQVTHISLPRRGLTGKISPLLGNLGQLYHLNLSNNQFFGSIPSEFFSLLLLKNLDLSYNRLSGKLPVSLPFKFIQTIDLSSNNFSGEISSSLFQFTESLVSFNISQNTFTGPFPSSVCTYASRSLEILDFSRNDFDGEFPLGFGMCSKLLVFKAGFNYISGSIPNDIYNVTELQELSLPVNDIFGPISDHINRLNNLKILELWGNDFDGFITESIGRLSKLESLVLHSNSFMGTLPSSLMNCTSLVVLNLRANLLEGNLSAFNFSKLIHLTSIDLGNNNFTGIVPPTLYSCKSLTAVRLAGNQLEGQISHHIVSLKSLTYLSISTNKLTNVTGAMKLLADCKNLTTLLLSGNFQYETLPFDENLIRSDQLQNLQTLGFCGCYFKGQVPVWLGKLKKLKFLEMSKNQLTGPLPGWLGDLPSLFYLNLAENLLSGKLPEELFKLPALESAEASLELPVILMPNNSTSRQYNNLASIPPGILLARNNLTGNIPDEIALLKFLHSLDLSNNKFYGKIPDQISKLINLESLDLSGNNLSGQIPPSLGRLHFLSQFSVANNNLNGPIPTGGQFDTFPGTSFRGNPDLCGSVVQQTCSVKEPNLGETENRNEPSDHELGFGLIAGAIFGFLTGSTTGWLLPIHKLKHLAQCLPKKQAVYDDQQLQGLNQEVRNAWLKHTTKENGMQ